MPTSNPISGRGSTSPDNMPSSDVASTPASASRGLGSRNVSNRTSERSSFLTRIWSVVCSCFSNLKRSFCQLFSNRSAELPLQIRVVPSPSADQAIPRPIPQAGPAQGSPPEGQLIPQTKHHFQDFPFASLNANLNEIPTLKPHRNSRQPHRSTRQHGDSIHIRKPQQIEEISLGKKIEISRPLAQVAKFTPGKHYLYKHDPGSKTYLCVKVISAGDDEIQFSSGGSRLSISSSPHKFFEIPPESLKPKLEQWTPSKQKPPESVLQSPAEALKPRSMVPTPMLDIPSLGRPVKKESGIIQEPKKEVFGDVSRNQGPEALIGERTQLMKGYLETDFESYDPSNKKLKIEGEDYLTLSSDVTDISSKKIVSCGAHLEGGREIILLDPENSRHLTEHYDRLKAKLLRMEKTGKFIGENSEGRIIAAVSEYVSEGIFPGGAGPKMLLRTTNFIKEKELEGTKRAKVKPGRKVDDVPIISIDDFVNKGVGVCRHQALVLAYLLDRLTKEEHPMISGVVQQMRGTVRSADYEGDYGHVWVSFSSTSGSQYMLDSMLGVVEDYSTPEGEIRLKLKYNYGGGLAINPIDGMKERAIRPKKIEKPS